MRILQVIAELGTGGAESVVTSLSEGLAARGHAVRVASDHGWRVARLEAVPGVDHVPIPLAAQDAKSLVASAARLLVGPGLRGAELVHAHNVRATLAAVTTVHGLRPEDYPTAVRVLRRCSDRVVAVSEPVAAELCRAGLAEDRIEVVENAVLPEAVPGDDGGADDAGGRPGTGPVVLCAARMTDQKRQDLLIHAWARRRRREGRLLLAGSGPRRPVLESLAADLGVEGSVHFLGDRDDVPALMGAADLLVLPSRWEGLPIVVLEAMAAGVPVLASAVGGLQDLGDVVGLVSPSQTEHEEVLAWTAALDHTTGAGTHAARDRAARAGVLVATRFSPEQMLERYLTVYDGVC